MNAQCPENGEKPQETKDETQLSKKQKKFYFLSRLAQVGV